MLHFISLSSTLSSIRQENRFTRPTFQKVLGGFDVWWWRRVPIRARISPMSVEWTPPDPGTIWSDGASWSAKKHFCSKRWV